MIDKWNFISFLFSSNLVLIFSLFPAGFSLFLVPVLENRKKIVIFLFKYNRSFGANILIKSIFDPRFEADLHFLVFLILNV